MKLVTAESVKQSAGQRQKGIFALTNYEIRESVNGKFLSLTLTDKTGILKANWFDRGKLPDEIKLGSAVEVEGRYNQQYSNLTVDNVTAYTDEVDANDFLNSLSEDDIMLFIVKFDELKDSIADNNLKGIVEAALRENEDRFNKFTKWPAAQMIHHAYLGGLIEHTVNVARTVAHDCELYKANRDMAVTGALLHDIGKLKELDVGITVTYTDIGDLLGHILLGYEMVKEHTDNEELLHIIASHHGTPEQRAIATPHTLEAYLVYQADYKDGRANRYHQLIKEQRERSDNVSGVDYFLETRVYAKKSD